MNRPAAFAFRSAILRGRCSLMSAVVSPAPMNRKWRSEFCERECPPGLKAARLAAERLAADPVAAAPSLVLYSRSRRTRDAITDCARAMKKPGAVSQPGSDILLQSAPFIAKRRNVVNKFG